MKNLKQIKKIIDSNKEEWVRKYKVQAMFVFGSYARQEQKKNSDVDVLVEFIEPISLFDFLDLEEKMTEALGIKVDLVSKKALKPRIGEAIFRELVPV